MNQLKIAATANTVHLIRHDGKEIKLTPELAEEMAKLLPQFAEQARNIATGGIPDTGDMAAALNAMGLRWRLDEASELEAGWWEGSQSKRLTLTTDYTSATLSLYMDLIGYPGAIKH